MHHDTTSDPQEFWEEFYGEAKPIWSGRVNSVLLDIASSLAPGTALDLGSGEGADVIWLAQQGWHATGVELSNNAVLRAHQAAQKSGVLQGQAEFEVADLESWMEGQPAGRVFDLVTASFLQSPVELQRAKILRAATERVAGGGHLLVVSHAAFPSPVQQHDSDHPPMPTVESELTDLGLSDNEWNILVAESRGRTVTGPEGQPLDLEDIVICAQRL